MNLFKTNLKFWAFLMLAGTLTLTSCTDDGDDDDPVLVEDGFYLTGAGTSFEALGENALLADANNEVGQESRVGMYETYIAMEAGASFSVTKVTGEVQATFGSNDLAAVDLMGERDQPNVTVWKGTWVEGGAAITVPDQGLYHVVIDEQLSAIVVIPVTQWGCIGAAFDMGWSGDIPLLSTGFGLQSMTFEAQDVTIMNGQGKFRHSGGWKVEIDGDSVKVNTNLGGTLTALTPGGDNITFDQRGIYTVSMNWSAANGTFVNLVKTGDVMAIDYTDYEMGIIGDAYFLADGVTQAAWDEPLGLSAPVVNGTVYTWTYDMVDFIENAAWKIRQGMDWSGISVGFGDATWTGDAAANFEDDGGNIKVVSGGNHKIVFTIDAATETRTIEATKL